MAKRKKAVIPDDQSPFVAEKYPGGITWVDSSYDERLGAALEPDASKAKTRSAGSRAPRRHAAAAAVQKAFPSGVPDAITNANVVREVRKHLSKDASIMSDDTILRAADRK